MLVKGNEEESNMYIKAEYNARGDKLLKIVSTESGDFRYRDDERLLPAVGAFCKKCRTETAKPFYPIIMNGQDAYALKCEKCGSEYPMYRSMYIQRYIGHDLHGGGHVNPTHGMKSRKSCRNRSNERKKLIDQGILKYVKNVGIVDTRTNQVLKF